MKKLNLIILLALFLAISCTDQKSIFAGEGLSKPDHSAWTALLQKHVNDRGFVDYEGIIEEKAKLDAYANQLSENPPQSNWTDNEKIAYWINAYNVFTVKLIAENYPLESIKDLNPTFAIPTVNTVWTKKWFKIGGEDFSLDQIEHKILRKDFEEPRIHFAVNCASFSCPPLRNEAFVASKLDQQLDEQATQFINDEVRNKIKKDEVIISKIFQWFTGDFTENQSLIDFLNRYSEVKINQNADINHMDYDWALNDTK